MTIIKNFYDLETTGTDPRRHSIHEISGIIEIDDQIVEKYTLYTRPHPKALIDEGALIVCKKTKEEILSYPDMKTIHSQFKGIMCKYINPFDTKNKIFNIGYNNRAFDDVFLREWFIQNGDDFIGSLFWTDTIDVLCLASEYLTTRRASMPSFKLKRVAKELGIVIEEDKLHSGFYDVELTRSIYRIVTGRDLEI